MRKSNQLSACLASVGMLVLLAGCATSRCPSRGQSDASPEPYVRVAYPDANTVEFQTAVRRFVPNRRTGPEIWLVGASHVGDPDYFTALQRHLDARDLVLFEGIRQLEEGARPRRENDGGRMVASTPDPSSAVPEPDASSLQANLARSLGLVFQLEAINYHRPHFRNSDLSADEIHDLMAKGQPKPRKGTEESAGAEFAQLVETMQGTSLFGAVLKAMFDIIGNSPHLQALTRLAMIEVLGQLQGDLAELQGLPPELKHLLEVLIRERNKTVVDDLKAHLKAAPSPGSLAVLYGVGHLPDLEHRLWRDLRYCPADGFWLTVFGVNTRRAGLSAWETGLVRMVVRSQLQGLQPQRGK